ncbi:flagellar hook-associated protein FlgL [Marinobacter xestospongiae]|uniref:Flagellar hook-associated protein FlgL n=1 Tax=Marinobacter xestospongiae TaxID=994319 RepID=A0ABU3VWT4_9GAMM|nr:flagellar hook-associated protein FlgL [Marinobacter xestospongiae]MDV2078646.1 flagellar hook-associated protein FlgL [Marinobacter xestospongiae]
MRVSSGQLNQIVLQGLRQQDKSYADVMTQMSSGLRINRISDDPLGTVSLIGLEREQTSYQQYRDNATRVMSRMEQSETYLNTSFNALLRVQDLALAASNDSATNDDRQAMASELRTLKDTLVNFANARDEEGNYLFSGSQLDTAPVSDTGAGLAYQGDNLRREVPVAQGVTLAANETIESVYFNGGNFFTDLETFITDLETGSATLDTTGPAMLDAIDRTVNGIGQKLTEVGSRIKSAKSLEMAQEDLALTNEKIRGKIQDLDYLDAMGRVSQIELAMNTTQKTYSKLSQLSLFNHL